jgi:hypothetical protein
MLLEPAPAAAATGCRSATAAAPATAACPRLTGRAVRLKDPIFDYRSNDLTAIDRGTGEPQEAREPRAARLLFACAPAAATQVLDTRAVMGIRVTAPIIRARRNDL